VGETEIEPSTEGGNADAEEQPVYAAPRDAVTGEPLSPDALYLRTVLNRAYPPATVLQQLHVSRPMPFRGRVEDHQYWHGGPEWTRALEKLVGGATSAELLEAERRWQEWWLDDYVVARLRVRIGAVAMTALLEWKRDGKHYLLVTRRYRKGDQWLETQLRKATAIVRAEYLPREDRPMRPRHSEADQRAG
jgi:hypothetical protein